VAEKHKKYRATENGKLKHREHMRDYMVAWRKRRKEDPNYDPAEDRRKWREQHKHVRERAMQKLGGSLCATCGCNEVAILEINHIHSGGRKQLRTTQNRQLYRAIINDKVELTEYNVLCRVCNALHYVQDILGVSGHTVFWRDSLMVRQ
jgi:hypothetical protein